MRPPLQPLNFPQQFIHPALRLLVAACVPYASLRTAIYLEPRLFEAHRHLHTLAFFFAHTFGCFLLISAGTVLCLGVILGRPSRSAHKP